MTIGPWRGIYLDSYNVRLSDVRIDSSLSGDGYDQASLTAQIQHSGSSSGEYTVDYTLSHTDGSVIKSAEGKPATEKLNWDLKADVKAWYPLGHGEQPLYKLDLHLKDFVSSLYSSKDILTAPERHRARFHY